MGVYAEAIGILWNIDSNLARIVQVLFGLQYLVEIRALLCEYDDLPPLRTLENLRIRVIHFIYVEPLLLVVESTLLVHSENLSTRTNQTTCSKHLLYSERRGESPAQ